MNRVGPVVALLAVVAALAVWGWSAPSARADDLPDRKDPDCEVGKVQKAGESCRECRSYPRASADCAPLGAAGFKLRCERGDGREVWCKPDAPGGAAAVHVTSAGFDPEQPSTNKREPIAPPRAEPTPETLWRPGCNAVPFVLPAIGILGLLWLRMKKKMNESRK